MLLSGLAELAMINICTTFEVPNFTRYEDMKSVAKCRKWGDLV